MSTHPQDGVTSAVLSNIFIAEHHRGACLLFGGLSRGQGGGHRASRLSHIEELLFISGWCYQAFVLVTPHNQVKKVIQELLRNVICGTMLAPKQQTQRRKIKFADQNNVASFSEV